MGISKSCDNCGKGVPPSTKIGDYCPHCHARFGRERTQSGVGICGIVIVALILLAPLGVKDLITYFKDRSTLNQVAKVMAGEKAAAEKEGRTLEARLGAQIIRLETGPLSVNDSLSGTLKLKNSGPSEPARLVSVDLQREPVLLVAHLSSKRHMAVMTDLTTKFLTIHESNHLPWCHSIQQTLLLDPIFAQTEAIARKLRDHAREHGGNFPNRPEEAFADKSVFSAGVTVSEHVARYVCSLQRGTYAFWYAGGPANDDVFLLELSPDLLSGLVGQEDGSVKWLSDTSFKNAKEEFENKYRR